MGSIFSYKGSRYLIKMNEKNSGVPVLIYEETATYFFNNLSLKGDLYF